MSDVSIEQLERVAQALELAIPAPAPARSYPGPVEIHPVTGFISQWHWCDKHGCEYLKAVCAGVLSGVCPKCNQEENDERSARQLVTTRAQERSRRVDEGLKAFKDQIARDRAELAAQRAEAFVESIRMQLDNDARAPYLEKVAKGVDGAMFQEALREIRGEQ